MSDEMRGERGPKGDHGQHGDTGSKGAAGERGHAGETGLQGSRGERGPIGDEGTRGPRGEHGRIPPHILRAFAIVIAVAFVVLVGLQWQLRQNENQTKDEINNLGKAGCLSGRTSTKKYNDFVQSAIDVRVDLLRYALKADHNVSLERMLKLGKTSKNPAAKIQVRAIHRYQGDFLPVKSIEQCNRPILK